VDSPWFVYLLHCADGSLYAGITVDVDKRLAAHNAGRGARYTRARLPVTVAWLQECESGTHARQLEVQLKRQTRATKCTLALLDDDHKPRAQ
jgi:putative endonuclease